MGLSLGDYLRESIRPFGDPIGLYQQDKEQRLQNKLGDVFNDETTRGQINFVGDQAEQFGGLRSRAHAAVNNTANRTRRAAGAHGSAAAAATLGDQVTGARAPGDVVSNALRRAKARVGVINRGDAAGRNQQLTDRLAQVKAGIAAQGRGIQTQTKGQNIMSGVNVASSDARARGDAAVAGAFGSAAGGIAAMLKDNKSNNGKFFDFGKKG